MRSTNSSYKKLHAVYLAQACCNFSFYGLKSIFVLYALSQFPLAESETLILFSTFMSLCYATSLIGGMMADKSLGLKNSIVIAGALSVLGLLCFMFAHKDGCLLGLALLSLGSGFFKPNLSTAVGACFENPQDPRKEKAYSFAYMAMNFGSLLGPLLCSFISFAYGWNFGIALIACSYLASSIFFYNTMTESSPANQKYTASVITACLFLIPVTCCLFLLLKYRESFHGLMGIIAVSSLVYFARIFSQCEQQERKGIIRIVFYIVLFTLFCSLFEQAGSSLMLFFENAVNRQIFGTTIPSSAFLSIGPLFVLVVIPVLIWLSQHCFKGYQRMRSTTKMGIGFLLVASSFWVLALGAFKSIDLVPAGWVAGFTLLQTMGEVLIVPVGFANISRDAPLRFRSVMMSFWLMAISYGHYIGGFIARYSLFSLKEVTQGLPDKGLSGAAPFDASLGHYASFFFQLGFMPLAIGALLIVLSFLRQYRKIFNVL